MDNYIVFSAARTGSSYFTSALAKQIGCIEPNVFYGGEFFRWEEYFQLGSPASVSPGNLNQLKNNPHLLADYDQSPPTGKGMHFHMGKDGRIHREFRDTLWEEHQPVSFLRAWEESQRRLSLLESTPFSWVIKVFPEHFHCLDLHRFQKLLQRKNTKVVILYRNFMWDWLLSWTAVRQTGVFQETKIDSDWKKPDITPKNLPLDFIETWYDFAHEFVNMCYSYRRSADHVVAYENFTGNPQRDAYRITGIDLFPEVVHQIKLWSTKEKESMISNIDEVKARFLVYCRLLGFPNGKLVI